MAVQADLTLTRILNGLSNPTAARFLPDGRLVILEQGGTIRVYTGTLPLIDAGTIPADFSGERGLLGLAVDPQFATSNRLYFYYSDASGTAADRHRVAWATIDPVTSEVDVAGRTVILRDMHGPANHDGGGIEFGPDGYLYVGVGDTGCNCGCSPGTNTNNYYATCLTNVNGKILRIDRDGNIPATNPLVGLADVTACGEAVNCFAADGQAQEADPLVTGAPRTEIYAWGFRNPFRFSFDALSGYLWIGDVGEVTWEEITISRQAGEHHGWPYREGANGLDVLTCTTVTPNTIGACVEPAFNYQHNGAASVIGGIFSNHCSWPAPYNGLYWFGDYNVGRVWTLTPNGARDGITGGRTNIVRAVTGVAQFFEGNDGAVYYVDVDDGEIWRIAPANPVNCNPTDAGVDDQGLPEPADSGVVDGGEPADSGANDEDSGVAPADAANPAPDASGNPDAAAARDAAVNPPSDAGGPNGNASGGCGCDASGGTGTGSAASSSIAFFFVVAIAWARRRRIR